MIAVDLITDVQSPSGYSNHAREIIKALHPHVDLRLIDHKCNRLSVELPPEEAQLFQNLINKSRDPQVRIQFETPDFFSPDSSVVNIGFTQWETTYLPDEDYNGDPRFNWVTQMNRMDAMFTSCTQAKKAFMRSGVVVPTLVMQGPIDTELYKPGYEELPLPHIVFDPEKDEFIPREKRLPVVFYMAEWTERKNIEDFLYVMFSRFTKDDCIVLLKAYGRTMDDSSGQVVEERVKQISEWIGNPDRPRVVVITEKLTDREIAQLYSSVDIYVNTSRGEGFCLPLVQAMASEVFPVSCGFSAPADYIRSPEQDERIDPGGANGYLVGYTLSPVVRVQGNPWYRYKQDWAQVDCRDLTHKVREIIRLRENNRPLFDLMCRNARGYTLDHMSHGPFGRKLAEGIERVYRQNRVVTS